MELNFNELAAQAKQNEVQKEKLIRKSEPFIIKCAYKTTKHYVSKNDDEWSIALIWMEI